MKVFVRTSLAVSVLSVVAGLPAAALARCGDAPGDLAAVCAARALADAQCNCATAPSHGSYVRCVASVANSEVAAGHLPRACRRNVVRCAAKSTCGKPGTVTCCRIYPVGVEKCSVKRDASLCRPPNGGTATIGTRPSCCDACVDGCPAVTTSSSTIITSTTSTSTTTVPGLCGNGTRDPGEQCDGSDLGGATCASAGGSFTCPTCTGGCTLDCSCCAGGSCATTTTTSTSTSSTTSTTVICEPIVPGEPIPNTYNLLGVAGPKLCITGSANQFQPCSGDGDCGGASGSCLQTPWVTADGFAFQFPTNISTTFTVVAEDSPPTCSHAACIKCGNPDAACTGIPGCGTPPAPPTAPCVKNTCCDQPGFVVPTFIVPILGGLCGRVDQYACGVGVVNTSHPQTGDNEVNKTGDTSDPGADCCYNNQPASQCINGTNLNDDPPAKPCTNTGAGSDTKGKVVRSQGNGMPDANGVHLRLSTPELATVWQDGQGCPDGATYDSGELLVSQLGLNAEPSTAGATGRFMDLNNDTCARAGSGFSSGSPNGPVVVGPPAAQPAPYAGGGSISVAAGPVFSGAAPLYDIGFVAVTPNGAATVAAAETCSCIPVAGCPE